MTDWNLAHSSVLTCYKVIEASFSSKLADEHRRQISSVGGSGVLVQSLEENGDYELCRISLSLDFTAAQH